MHWMAQGFIQPLGGDEDLEDVGHVYFMDLLWRSFFQVAGEDESGNVESFTMHDLMHDLACSVAGTECCIANLKAEKANERTRHVSFEDELDSSWKIPSTLLKAKRLRTFIQDGGLDQSTCNALMSNFQYLRVLKLSSVGIERLPHSIGKLKHFRALYLLENEDIKELPSSLCRLQNLQTLYLYYCFELEKLPRKTRKLVCLRYLYIDDCESLAYMPRGLGQLTCLRMLNKFVVGKPGKQVESGSTYLKEKLNLKSLELSWDEVDDDEDDHVINVKYEMVFECLQPHPNLETLEVDGYPGSKISSWLSSMANLTELILEFCFKCKHLPPLHQLSSLKLLPLKGFFALENVSENEKQKELSSSKSKTILPSLQKLILLNCPNLKGWWRGDVDEASNEQLPCFPCLSNLSIEWCPNQTSMPLFPSVRKLNLTKTSSKPLRQTMKLKMTTSEAPSSSLSSSLFPPFSKLTEMSLEEIEDLDTLPEEFLQNLTSLQSLTIIRCINLTSMPKGMHWLTSLKELEISGCPNLSDRFQRVIGEDWPYAD
ncbi:hypothetical protein CRYUN_Cryun40dG0079900 [Craigia yunnanensis]